MNTTKITYKTAELTVYQSEISLSRQQRLVMGVALTVLTAFSLGFVLLLQEARDSWKTLFSGTYFKESRGYFYSLANDEVACLIHKDLPAHLYRGEEGVVEKQIVEICVTGESRPLLHIPVEKGEDFTKIFKLETLRSVMNGRDKTSFTVKITRDEDQCAWRVFDEADTTVGWQFDLVS